MLMLMHRPTTKENKISSLLMVCKDLDLYTITNR